MGDGVGRWRKSCCWLVRARLGLLRLAVLGALVGLCLVSPFGRLALTAALAQMPAASPTGGSSWQTAVDPSKDGKPKPVAPRRSRIAEGHGIRALSTEVRSDGDRTIFYLQLSGAPGVQVYTLASPHRVVVDLAGVEFQLPAATGRQAQGAIASFRYGLMSAGQSRIVMDLLRPMRVEAADLKPAQVGLHRLELRLVPTDETTFIREASQPLPDKPLGPAFDPQHEEAALKPGATKSRSRPVIVLDPGHGGVDPGAIGTTDINEKSLVLAVAKQVKALLCPQHYAVLMTRSSDVYVGLDARLELSRRAEADLFVSIHADAIDGKLAHSVRGATIYTLSEKASDAQAQRLAEKENAADSVAGLASVPEAERDNVKGILIDLMRRETANFSSDFSRLLVGRLGQSLSLAKDPQRSAAFKVLKQTQSPSVLIELGYMTNVEDERQMRKPEWQRKVAQSIAASIDAYFTKRTTEGLEQTRSP